MNLKKNGALLLAAVLLFSGCASAFEKEFTYSAPFAYSISRSEGDATEISNYNMLKSALLNLINNHEENATFRFSRYNGSVTDDLAEACLEVKTSTPLGAYAVENLTSDASRIVSYYTAEVQISYQRTLEEIQSIAGASTTAELESLLLDALTEYRDNVVLRVYSPQVDEENLSETLETLYFSNPVKVVTQPRVEITSYPAEGVNRIYDIHLHYGHTPARLTDMSRKLSETIAVLAPGMAQETARETALECAVGLYRRVSTPTGAYADTAYGAIVEQSAGHKGLALGYQALCDALGIPCMVVKGNIGDRGRAEHFWNIIGLGGEYYHVDLSRFGEGVGEAFLLDDASLWGSYLWDTARYPACHGTLRYSDFFPEPTEPEIPSEPGLPSEPAASARPQATTPPATAAPQPATTTPPSEGESPEEGPGEGPEAPEQTVFPFEPQPTDSPVETPPSEEPAPPTPTPEPPVDTEAPETPVPTDPEPTVPPTPTPTQTPAPTPTTPPETEMPSHETETPVETEKPEDTKPPDTPTPVDTVPPVESESPPVTSAPEATERPTESELPGTEADNPE